MFSVIIPVYNGEKYIENAVKSVMEQTVTDWELVIVNDGSADNTAEVLKQYSDIDKIKVVHQENQGVSVARNNGALNAKGEYIAFLDADDVWYENHLEVMEELIAKYPNAGLYGTFTRAELVNGGVIEECNFFKNRDEDVYLEDFFEEYNKDKSAKMFTVITTCVSKEAFEKSGGFPVGCKIGEDLELSLVVAAYYPVVLCKKITATYKKENSSATKDKSFDPDWGFFNRVEKLYNDADIAKEKKQNLKKSMEWFSMRRCRHYIIDGNKKKAWAVFRAMDKGFVDFRDTAINMVLLLMPVWAVRKIFARRWRGKA